MSAPSDSAKPPPALDAIVDRVLAYNPKKDRQMSEPAQETITRLEAEVEALYEVVRIIIREVPDNRELQSIYSSLGNRIDSLSSDDTINSVGSEARLETFEHFRGVIKDTGRLR